jgi:hypothetical protein
MKELLSTFEGRWILSLVCLASIQVGTSVIEHTSGICLSLLGGIFMVAGMYGFYRVIDRLIQ